MRITKLGIDVNGDGGVLFVTLLITFTLATLFLQKRHSVFKIKLYKMY